MKVSRLLPQEHIGHTPHDRIGPKNGPNLRVQGVDAARIRSKDNGGASRGLYDFWGRVDIEVSGDFTQGLLRLSREIHRLPGFFTRGFVKSGGGTVTETHVDQVTKQDGP